VFSSLHLINKYLVMFVIYRAISEYIKTKLLFFFTQTN